MLELWYRLSPGDRLMLWFFVFGIAAAVCADRYDLYSGGYWKTPKTERQRTGAGIVGVLFLLAFAGFFLSIAGKL